MARFLSEEGADSPMGPFGVLPKIDGRFHTPPSEPDVRLSAHPALHSSVFLSLYLMTEDAECLEVFHSICIHWFLEPSHWSFMVYMSLLGRDFLPAFLTLKLITCQHYGSQVSHSWPCFPSEPAHILGEFFPLDCLLPRIGIGF